MATVCGPIPLSIPAPIHIPTTFRAFPAQESHVSTREFGPEPEEYWVQEREKAHRSMATMIAGIVVDGAKVLERARAVAGVEAVPELFGR